MEHPRGPRACGIYMLAGLGVVDALATMRSARVVPSRLDFWRYKTSGQPLQDKPDARDRRRTQAVALCHGGYPVCRAASTGRDGKHNGCSVRSAGALSLAMWGLH